MSCIAPRCRAARELGALFCAAHLAAPSGTRGGWISAWRRAQRLGGGERPIDASVVAKRLWIGGVPPFDRDLPDFDVLVLCALEHQGAHPFHGPVYRCPLPDGELSTGELAMALSIARAVGSDLARRRRVLVTCHTGLDRSALVAGLALCTVTRAPAPAIVAAIRSGRSPRALSNHHFVELIHRYARRAPHRPAARSS